MKRYISFMNPYELRESNLWKDDLWKDVPVTMYQIADGRKFLLKVCAEKEERELKRKVSLLFKAIPKRRLGDNCYVALKSEADYKTLLTLTNLAFEKVDWNLWGLSKKYPRVVVVDIETGEISSVYETDIEKMRQEVECYDALIAACK